jgi:hypothetical protein
MVQIKVLGRKGILDYGIIGTRVSVITEYFRAEFIFSHKK